MAQYTIEEIYAGDKYHVMSDVMQEFFHKGRPVDYDTKTWLDMLIVKHSISVAETLLAELIKEMKAEIQAERKRIKQEQNM